MKTLPQLATVGVLAVFLSGCVAAAVGAGAAGGIYLDRKYSVKVTKKNKTSSTKKKQGKKELNS